MLQVIAHNVVAFFLAFTEQKASTTYDIFAQSPTIGSVKKIKCHMVNSNLNITRILPLQQEGTSHLSHAELCRQ